MSQRQIQQYATRTTILMDVNSSASSAIGLDVTWKTADQARCYSLGKNAINDVEKPTIGATRAEWSPISHRWVRLYSQLTPKIHTVTCWDQSQPGFLGGHRKRGRSCPYGRRISLVMTTIQSIPRSPRLPYGRCWVSPCLAGSTRASPKEMNCAGRHCDQRLHGKSNTRAPDTIQRKSLGNAGDR